MSSLGNPSPFFLAGKKGYEVKRSLRFNATDNANLTRTSSSASTTFTYSVWLKRTRFTGYQYIFSMSGRGFAFHATYNTFYLYDGNSLNQSTAVFRDPSAWYHIVVQINSGVATSYVNNVLVHNAIGSGFTLTTATNATRIGVYDSGDYDFQGYMAEINLVDGSVVAPSSFAETDAITGQWNPKKYVGSYGTNGFYLNFLDNSGTTATTLGKDSSGNGNNFTPNNFSVSAGAGNDSLTDTPTNNFAILNPLSTVHTENIQSMLTNGNLDYTPSGDYSIVKATIPFPSSGKWYVEAKINSATGGSAGIGVQRLPATSYNTNSYLSYQCNDYCYSYQGGGIIAKGSSSSTTVASSLEAFAANDILAILFDADNNEIKWYNNNTLIYTLDLSSAPDGFYINDGEWVFAFMAYSGDGTINVNFGQRPFNYTQPTGSKALSSVNLPDPTIKFPDKHFNTLIWDGDSANSRDITGLNFKPDWVWIKSRNYSSYGGGLNYNHVVWDALRGVGSNTTAASGRKELTTNENYAEGVTNNYTNYYGHVSAFNNNGFTLGKISGEPALFTNLSGRTYVGWNWNAGDTDSKTYAVTVVSDSGNKYRFDGFGTSAVTLDLAEGGTYIFDQSDSSNAGHPLRFSTTANGTHGGGSEYTTGVTTAGTPGSSGAYTQIVVAASAPTLYYYCSVHSGMGGQANTNSTLGSSNFDGTIQSVVKTSPTAGFSIVSYEGNNVQGATVGHGLGVAPSVVIVKNRESSYNWAIWHQGLTSAAYVVHLNLTNAQGSVPGIFNSTLPTSTVFSLGGGSQGDRFLSNEPNKDFIAYIFSEVAGYSKFGSYKGNGNSDGTFVFTDFRPSWILVKRSSGTENWALWDNKRDGGNNTNGYLLRPDSNTNEGGNVSGHQIDILSNGFKFRNSDSKSNNSGSTYIYFAFAESPFKNARAR